MGLDYLMKERLLSEGVIREFGLGYIPSNVRHQLAGRVIFPLYDPSNNLIVLSSRNVDGISNLPVYWHESYEKDFYLYGANLAKHAMRRWHFALVVEGQFDAIRLYDHGMKNTVAICGTKFSDTQLATIHRYCEEVVVILDADDNRAGQKASEKIQDKIRYAAVGSGDFQADDYRTKINTLTFHENLDPDEYLRKYGINQLKALVKEKVRELRNCGHQYN